MGNFFRLVIFLTIVSGISSHASPGHIGGGGAYDNDNGENGDSYSAVHCERLLSEKNRSKVANHTLPALQVLSEAEVYAVSSLLKEPALKLFGMNRKDLPDEAGNLNPSGIRMKWESNSPFKIVRGNKTIAQFQLDSTPERVYAMETIYLGNKDLEKMHAHKAKAKETGEPIPLTGPHAAETGVLLLARSDLRIYLNIKSFGPTFELITAVNCNRLGHYVDEDVIRASRDMSVLSEDGLKCRFKILSAVLSKP